MILYDINEINFNNNGLGFLSEMISCNVAESRNGEFELKATYPSTGALFNEIYNDRIIMCKPNPYSDPQPFRIYRITKPINKIITIYAHHISYDLSGVTVSAFNASSVTEALIKLKTSESVQSNFQYYTDKTTVANFECDKPSTSRSLLGGQSGSLLDVYGGEYEFDRFTVKLLNKRGQNNGVSIRYGKNLTDISQEENIANVYTGIYPFWKNSDVLVELPEKVVNAQGTFPKSIIKPVDFSSDFSEQPTEEQLREKANSYITSNNIGVPSVSISVSFISLDQTDEYKNIAILEKVKLCDDINVEFYKLGISTTAKCVKTEYDAILNRYTKITLGDATPNISDTIAYNNKEISEKPSMSVMNQAVKNATNWITNGSGYMVAVKDENGNWKEICSLDTPDIETAINVWRWNNGGFGFSSNGYNGPYETAITQDGKIVANFITSGTLNANVIRAGILSSLDNKSYWNLESGEMVLSGIFKNYSPITDKLSVTIRNNKISFYDYYGSGDVEVGSISTNSGGGINVRSDSFGLFINGVARLLITENYGFQLTDIKVFGDLPIKGNVKINGDLSVIGSKNRIVKTSSGIVALGAYETSEPYFGDIGEAKTDINGECKILIDPLFSETVNTKIPYQVFLQKYGRGDIWVEKRCEKYFIVKGDANISFSYEIKAKQKGYENNRLEVIKNGSN